MKKVCRMLSCALVACICVVYIFCFASVQTSACSPNQLTEEAFWNIIQEVYPDEYARAISVPTSYTESMSELPDRVVNKKSKEISNNETVVCFELSSGRAGFLYSVDFIEDSSISGDGYKTYTEHIYMSVTGYEGLLYITGFSYTLYENAYDRINNAGENSSGMASALIDVHSWEESKHVKATVTYSVPLEYIAAPGTTRFFYLYVYVGQDARTYELYAPTT